MTDQPKAQNFAEAPASWNVRYTLGGYDCQLTLRGDNGSEVLIKATAALKWLTDNGANPTPSHNGNGDGHTTDQPDMKVCELHNAEMKLHTKDGASWYSHKLADGIYCKGKATK